MKKSFQIRGLILLVIISLVLAYMSISLNNNQPYKIGIIELDGNIHLSKEQYLSFANLLDRSQYQYLSLQIIKDRIEKHPYISRADVKYDGNSKVSIHITEKEFEALLLCDQEQFLITANMEVLPMLPYTKKIDYPVIGNPMRNGKITPLKIMRDNKDIVTAFKMLTTVKLINPELYENLSEIDLRGGKDIIMLFSTLSYPVVVGRGDEVRKVIYFNNLWSYLKGKDINNVMDYVDLRYDKHIYLGITNSTTLTGENHS